MLYSLISINPCFAISKLYYLKNIKKESISKQIESVLILKNYTIKNKDPYYSISIEDPSEYNVIILQSSGENLYYYFNSNTKSKKLNKTILKTLKNKNISYEENEDERLLTNFSEIAQRTITGEKKEYKFPEIQYSKKNNGITSLEENKSSTTMKGFIGKVGKGESLDVYLNTTINTATAHGGDQVSGILNADWRTSNNLMVAEKGSILYGHITEASCAKAGLRNGKAEIVFTRMETPSGKSYEIQTEPIKFNVTNEGKAEQIITSVVTNALIGAGIGVLLGLISGDTHNILKGAAVGAGVSGTTTAAFDIADKGIDGEIPAYTNIEVKLKNDVDVVLSY